MRRRRRKFIDGIPAVRREPSGLQGVCYSVKTKWGWLVVEPDGVILELETLEHGWLCHTVLKPVLTGYLVVTGETLEEAIALYCEEMKKRV